MKQIPTWLIDWRNEVLYSLTNTFQILHIIESLWIDLFVANILSYMIK